MLTRTFDLGVVKRKLLFKKGAKLVVTSDASVETELDMAELAAIADVSATDIQKIDGITNGTAYADKALVLNASKGISTITSATITTLTAPTVNSTNVDAGASGTAGSVDVFPTTGTKGKLAITCTDQTGDTTVSLVAGAMGAARTITIRDPGAAASLLTTTDATAAATTATAAEITAVVAGNAATAAEITRSADISARIVTTTATALSLTVTQHAERVVLINTDSTVDNTFSLPAATGSGAKFTIINNFPQTQGTIVVAANGTDIMKGVAIVADTTAETSGGFLTTASSDKYTFDRTTTGGLGSDEVECYDIAANTWRVRVLAAGSGSLASGFSQT